MRWPEPEELEALTREVARRVLLQNGVSLPGFARALASQALPYLERARELVFDSGALSGTGATVLGAEVNGELTLEVGELTLQVGHSVRFKADLVERVGDRLRLTDYKTGRPFSLGGERARRNELIRRVTFGDSLQALAYRHAAGPDAEGRYLFLRPDLDDSHALVRIEPDPELDALFARTLDTIFSGLEAGAFFPRMVDAAGAEPRRCDYCEVAEACSRGDSGARRRLASFARAADGGDDAERAVLRLWDLSA